MTAPGFLAGVSELAFARSYHQTTLRKPQVVADSLLRAMVTSGQDDRLLVAAAVASELAEACRRLAAVHGALFDRRHSVGASLMRPLPGAAEWRAMATWAGSTPPEAMLRDLAIGSDAMESAERLRGQAELAWVTPLVAAAETGDIRLVRPDGASPRRPIVWASPAAELNPDGELPIAIGEDDAATLADMTADMVSIARGFLGSYLRARSGAGTMAGDE